MTPRAHLKAALAYHHYSQSDLVRALQIAKALGYRSEWIAAIQKALTDHIEAGRQIGNIITLMAHRNEGEMQRADDAFRRDEALRQEEE